MKSYIFFILSFLFAVSVFSQNTPEFFQLGDNYSDENIPPVFDLRDKNTLPEVKTRIKGGCWASAVISVLEARYFMLQQQKIELSDYHLMYCHRFDSSRNTNGNHYMASAYFNAARGPYLKNSIADSLCLTNATGDFYIPEARYLPEDEQLIKQIILNDGPVYSMMYYKKQFLDTLNFTYFTAENKINHAVSLVGWDDTFETKQGRGVWIAKNSFGKNYGDQGFFYITYEDSSILKYNAFWPKIEEYNPKLKVYYYDTLGAYFSYGFNDTTCSALTKFNISNNLKVKSISSYISYQETSLNFSLYKKFTGDSLLSEPIYESSTIFCKYKGFYSFELDRDIYLNEGEEIYVMVTFGHPTETKLIPIESSIKNYSDPHITSNTNWVNPDFKKWPYTWYTCGKESMYSSLNFDISIKLVGIEL